MFLATLAGRKTFLSAMLNLLIVGHTHEDIDHLFSVLLSPVVRRNHVRTPDELVTETQMSMASVFADRPEEVPACLLGEIFDCGAWLDAQGVHLHNAWSSRDGVDAPHNVCCKMREDLSAEDVQRSAVRRPPAPPHSEDVCCQAKRWTHSENIARIVLVLPRARLAHMRSTWPCPAKVGHCASGRCPQEEVARLG